MMGQAVVYRDGNGEDHLAWVVREVPRHSVFADLVVVRCPLGARYPSLEAKSGVPWDRSYRPVKATAPDDPGVPQSNDTWRLP